MRGFSNTRGQMSDNVSKRTKLLCQLYSTVPYTILRRKPNAITTVEMPPEFLLFLPVIKVK